VLDGNIATNGQATAALKAENDERAAEASRLTKLLKECNEKAAVAMESAKADSAKMVANLNAISAETEKKRMGEIADLTAENKRLVALLGKCGAEDKEKIAQMRKTSTDALKRYEDLNAEVCRMLGEFKVPRVPGVDN
jgi:seryl-tRNA synthetase